MPQSRDDSTHETRTSSPDSASPVALVTGGSRGIGLAVVRALAGDGYRVRFCSRRQSSVDDALRALQAPDRHVLGDAIDVRDQAAVDAFVNEVADEEGRLDVLVNNAGLGSFAPVDEISGDTWRNILHTNLDGAFYFTRAAVPVLRRSGGGWIFNVASLAGKAAIAGGSAYNASKFGLVGFSEASMLDLRKDDIRVVAILPGSVDTDFHSRDDAGWMLSPEDVARVVTDCLRYPARALPSRIELRPTHTGG